MLFSGFSLICLIHSLLAVELSIYKSFTQVRQSHSGVGDYTYQFNKVDYGNIIDRSISWDGTPFVRQEVYNTIQSLKDATVTFRRSTVCQCETIKAKIVDPDSMLLENLETGTFFYADKQSIEYTSTRPDDGSISIIFQFQTQTTQHTGTLSYLTKGITWTPNYDLFLIGNNDCKLRAYANINNEQQQEYTVENTNLLGGDVQLATTASSPMHTFDASRNPPSKQIEMVGKQRGIYSYTLKDKYTLRPLSSIRLPFIDILTKYQFYYKAMTIIGPQQYQGVFQRTYDLTPDHFMPAGIITIRDNQVLVGQAFLPDVPKNYTQTITVGQDNDVRYLVKGNMTWKSDENATIPLETYEIDLQFMNLKNKNVNTQLVLQGGVQITLLNTTCKSTKINGNQINFTVQLEQGETRQYKVNLTVRLA